MILLSSLYLRFLFGPPEVRITAGIFEIRHTSSGLDSIMQISYFFFELLHYLFSAFVHDLQTQDLHPFTTGNQTISIFGGDFRVMQTDSEFVRNPSVSCLLLHYLFVLGLRDDLQIQIFFSRFLTYNQNLFTVDGTFKYIYSPEYSIMQSSYGIRTKFLCELLTPFVLFSSFVKDTTESQYGLRFRTNTELY